MVSGVLVALKLVNLNFVRMVQDYSLCCYGQAMEVKISLLLFTIPFFNKNG